MLVGAGHAQLSSRFPHLSGDGHDDADTGAVDVSDAGEVENDFFAALVQQLFGGPLDLPAIVAHGDSSQQFQHHNVRFYVPGLNGQRHSRTPFELWQLFVANTTTWGAILGWKDAGGQ